MSAWFWIALVAAILVGVVLAVVLVLPPVLAARRQAQYERARRDFHRQRERLEARFVQLASASGKPRDLRWLNCDFEDDVAYARDRRSGQLMAFVGLTVSFEAVEGGLMEDVEAVGNLRVATAVFRCATGRWTTDGRAVFNLSPTETIAHFQANLEIVAQEVANRT